MRARNDWAAAYGVAGSPVVATTRIGGAPFTCTSPSLSPLAGSGMPGHDATAQFPPHGGSAAWNRVTSASSCAGDRRGRLGMVDAVDHRVGLDDRRVGAVGRALEVLVGHREQRAAPAVDRGRAQRARQHRPRAQVVERGEDAGLERAAGEHAGAGHAVAHVRRGQRIGRDARDEAVEHRRARRAARREERVERLLEPLRLRVRVVEARRPPVGRSVEHHRPHGRREHLRVRRADHGAVRVAEIGELGVAERASDRFEIACGVAGADLSRVRARCGSCTPRRRCRCTRGLRRTTRRCRAPRGGSSTRRGSRRRRSRRAATRRCHGIPRHEIEARADRARGCGSTRGAGSRRRPDPGRRS